MPLQFTSASATKSTLPSMPPLARLHPRSLLTLRPRLRPRLLLVRSSPAPRP
jgi:hypothetical protein